MFKQLPAKYVLTNKNASSRSWFWQIRDIFPHPMQLLEKPLSKKAFKNLARSLVVNYWENKLQDETSALDSLCFFKP